LQKIHHTGKSNTDKNTKFTVIIPTRERSDTLSYCLKTVTTQNYDNLEILVSDNFSQDDTEEVVRSFNDPRIIYKNTGKRVSMSHNWEFALNHVTDGWVTVVGDDDGLLPGALVKVASIIKETGCRAITSKWCYYYWPNSGVAQENLLIIPLSSGFEIRNGRKWLRKLMRGDAVYPDLPCLYTGGFANISVINHARERDGSFFLSMTPDVYSAIALASVLENYVMLNEPIAVAGVSSHSNGTSSLGIGTNLIPAAKFFSEQNIPFHRSLADGEVLKSIPIIVYESYLKSTHLHNDFLNVRMEDQLGLALSRAMPQHYADLRKYCSKIAHNNGICMHSVDHNLRKHKLLNTIQKSKEVLSHISGRLAISGKEFGIQDIYAAVILAKSTYLLETHYAHWKLDNVSRISKKILNSFFQFS